MKKILYSKVLKNFCKDKARVKGHVNLCFVLRHRRVRIRRVVEGEKWFREMKNASVCAERSTNE